MNWSLVISLLAILGIKLIGTLLFLQYSSQILYTSPLNEDSNSNQEGPKDCPIGWVSFGGKCYFFSAQEKTWENSRKDCRQANADLAVVNSEKELTFLKSNTKTTNYFVGLTRSNPSRTWRWINNSNLNQRIFPIPHNDHDCAVVGIEFTGSVSCFVPNRWICETKT